MEISDKTLLYGVFSLILVCGGLLVWCFVQLVMKALPSIRESIKSLTWRDGIDCLLFVAFGLVSFKLWPMIMAYVTAPLDSLMSELPAYSLGTYDWIILTFLVIVTGLRVTQRIDRAERKKRRECKSPN